MRGTGCLFMILILLAILSIGPLVFMWAWNAVIPHVFGLPEINFWMSIAVIIIATVLFKGKTIKREIRG